MLKLLPSVASSTQTATSPELQQDIEQFLYTEGMLLDDREFDQWYELLADDIHYYMPTRYTKSRRDSKKEISNFDEAAIFDDDKASLGLRIRRLATGLAWAEEPPSRTRHLVSNVKIRTTDIDGEYEVECCFVIYRNRLERQTDIFVGARRDLIRKSNNQHGWLIAKRHMVLDQGMLLANNISIFF
jgi:3-phenylpropionate/cinnamic acid dioxygenase small subunit